MSSNIILSQSPENTQITNWIPKVPTDLVITLGIPPPNVVGMSLSAARAQYGNIFNIMKITNSNGATVTYNSNLDQLYRITNQSSSYGNTLNVDIQS